MNASKFTITIEEQLSKAYQKFGCSISAEIIVLEGEDFQEAAKEARTKLYTIVHNTAVQGINKALESVNQDI